MKNKFFNTQKRVFKKSAIAVALFTPALSMAQSIESVKYTGQISSLVPAVKIDISQTPTAFVEDITVALDEDGQHCRLTTSEQDFQYSYRAGKEPVCLFEWMSNDIGIPLEGMKNIGVINKINTVGIAYQVSVMNSGEKTVILSDALSIDVLSPTDSVITGLKTYLGGQELTGFDIEHHDRRQGLRRLLVEVEPRTFEQIVTVMGEVCLVPEGETTCNIDMGNFIPGRDSESLQGTEQLNIATLDTKDYLQPATSNVDIIYDYRPPHVTEFIVNADGEDSAKTYSIYDTEFELAKDEGLLIMHSDHTESLGDWWLPKVKKFELVPNAENKSEIADITINDLPIRVPQLVSSYRENYSLAVGGEPQIIQDKIVFPVSVSSLPDGKYDINAIVEDSFENSSAVEGIEKLIDRNAPVLAGIFGGDVVRTNDPVYPIFMSDMYLYVSSGWEDGAELTSVTLNGEPFAFNKVAHGLYQLAESDSLIPREQYRLEVTAEDSSGNQASTGFDVIYSDATFELHSKSDTVYAGIQDNDITLVQRGGQRCRFTNSAELAQEISRGPLKGCTIDTSRVPIGLNVEVDSRGLALDGAIRDVGNHEVGFDVVYHNHDGSTKSFPSETINIEALESEGINIELLDRNKIADGVYSIAYNSRYSTEFMVSYFNANVDIDIAAGGNEENTFLRQSRRTQPVDRKVKVRRVDGGDSPVWSTVKYDVEAKYEKDPSQTASASFDVIITPATYTKAYLEVNESKQILTNDSITLSGRVGTFDRDTREIVYRPEEMGDWTATLAVRDTGGYAPISDAVDIDQNGMVDFTISGKTLFDASRQFYMIAKSKSEVPNFEMEIRSRSAFLEVLKAGAVEGSIRTRSIESRIPFDTSMVFSFEEDADEDVSGNYVWQVSEDGTTWSNISDMDNERRFDISVDEVGTTSYRVALINRITGVESFSDTVSISGYDVADIELKGPSTTFSGLPVTFEAQVSDEFTGNSDGIFEWSMDGGATWEYGTNTLSFTPTESLEIGVRYRLDSSEGIATDDVYSQRIARVNVREPSPLSLSLATPRSMEVGMEGEITGRYREPFRDFDGRVIEIITLPDGTEVEAGSLTYIPAPEDIVDGSAKFKYTAWVEGLEEQTKSTEERDINLYDYQFNAPTLNVRQRYTVAPTSAYASVFLNNENESPDIEYDYDWLMTEEQGFDVTRDNGDRVSFDITESGSKLVAVRVSDNRGNEAEVSQIVDVREAVPMTIDMNPRYSKPMTTAPIGVTMQALYTFDHPADYPISLKWYIDGELVNETTSDRNFFEITEQGNHEVKVIIDSAYGQQGIESMVLDISPNIPPICSPTLDDRGTKIVVSPNCTDEDGSIVQTFYSWDGQDELQGYSRINFNKPEFPNLKLNIRAIDDGGEETSATISW